MKPPLSFSASLIEFCSSRQKLVFKRKTCRHMHVTTDVSDMIPSYISLLHTSPQPSLQFKVSTVGKKRKNQTRTKYPHTSESAHCVEHL